MLKLMADFYQSEVEVSWEKEKNWCFKIFPHLHTKPGGIIQRSLYLGGPAPPWETLRKPFHESTLSSLWLGLRVRRRGSSARAQRTVWMLAPVASKRAFRMSGVLFHYLQWRMGVTETVITAIALKTTLVVQWLRMCLAMQGTQGWSLVGELRSHMPQSEPACCKQSLCASKKDLAWCREILCAAANTWCSQIKNSSDCSQFLSTCYELGILSKLREIVEDRGAWQAIVHGVAKGWTWHSSWTTTDFWTLTHLTFTTPWQANPCDRGIKRWGKSGSKIRVAYPRPQR